MSVHVGSAGAVLHIMPGGGHGSSGSSARFCVTFLPVYSPGAKTVAPLLRAVFLKLGRGFRVESVFCRRVEVGGSSALEMVVEVGENAKHLGGQYLKAIFTVRQNRM
jgi:hypothetical protein